MLLSLLMIYCRRGCANNIAIVFPYSVDRVGLAGNTIEISNIASICPYSAGLFRRVGSLLAEIFRSRRFYLGCCSPMLLSLLLIYRSKGFANNIATVCLYSAGLWCVQGIEFTKTPPSTFSPNVCYIEMLESVEVSSAKRVC